MKIPFAIKKPTAPTPDLEQQLSAADEAAQAARKVVAAAQARFDADGSDKHVQELREAVATQDTAELHLARARRLLAAAQERDRAEEVARLEKRIAAQLEQLGRPGVIAAATALVEREAKATVEVARARAERVAMQRALKDKLAGLRGDVGALEDLAGPRGGVMRLDEVDRHDHANEAVSYLRTRARLAQLAADEPLEVRALLERLLPDVDAYRVDAAAANVLTWTERRWV